MPIYVQIILYFVMFAGSLVLLACSVAELLSFNTQRGMIAAAALAGFVNLLSLTWLSFYLVEMLGHSFPAGAGFASVLIGCYLAALLFAIHKTQVNLSPPEKLAG